MNSRTRLEGLLGQRQQHRLLDREVLVHGPRPRADPAVPVVQVPLVDHLVQLGEGGDFWDRGEVVAAEVADHPFDAALLVGSFDAWAAVEALDGEVGAESDPPVGLHPGPAQAQHLGDGRLQVVVADLASRDTAERAQCVHVPLEEGFLAAGGEDPVDGFARVGQAKREQVAGHQLAYQAHGHVAEVDLRLVTGQVGLRHERFHRGFARGCEDLGLPVGDVAPDHRV